MKTITSYITWLLIDSNNSYNYSNTLSMSMISKQ